MLKKNKGILITFLILFILSLIYCFLIQSSMHWYFTSYLLDYKNGFISRGFIGNIFQKIFPLDYSYRKNVTILVKILWTIIDMIYIYLFIKMGSKIKDKITQRVFLLIGMSSFPILYIVPYLTLKLDFVWVYIYFICMFLLLKKGLNILNGLIIIILSSIGILSHQAFIFATFPFIFLFIILDIYFTKEKKQIKNKILLLIFLSLIIFILFLICQFLGKIDINIISKDVYDKLIKINEIKNEKEFEKSNFRAMLRFEYEIDIFNHLKILKKDYFRNLGFSIIIFIISSINLVFYYEVFKEKLKKLSKYIFIILGISQLPLYLLTSELIRWTLLFRFNLFVFLIFFIWKFQLFDFKSIFFNKYKLPMTIFTFFNLILSYRFCLEL